MSVLPVFVTGRGGLGDAIYARPFVRYVAGGNRAGQQIAVETSWPWVFSDLGVRVVKRSGLAVQAHHAGLVSSDLWAPRPKRAHGISLRYRWGALLKRSVIAEMEDVSRLRLGGFRLDLPPLPDSAIAGPYAVVRPPAARLDYPGPAREPDPAYLAAAARALRAAGLPVVTVGFWLPGLEEPSGEIEADQRFERGELALPELFALVAGATVVVAGPCWLVPFCLASRTPMVALAGGCGGRNAPEALVDTRTDTGLMRWIMPDDYCRCRSRFHACPKAVSDFDAKFAAALDVAGVAA